MKNLRILIADDEALIRMDIQEMLEAMGHEVVAACSDGWQAWQKIQELKPDLILLDIEMPKLDGLVVAQKIKDQKLGPVIMLTAYAQEKYLNKAEQQGVFGYLIKPILQNQLQATMQIAWQKYQDYVNLEQELEDVKAHMDKRKTLAKAKAILMEIYKIDEQQALRRIQTYSMNKQMPMEQVAKAIIKQAGI